MECTGYLTLTDMRPDIPAVIRDFLHHMTHDNGNPVVSKQTVRMIFVHRFHVGTLRDVADIVLTAAEKLRVFVRKMQKKSVAFSLVSLFL